MNRAALIDANIPIYATGGEHPLKKPCINIIEMIAKDPDLFVTTSEVLQEILHHYRTRRAWTFGREMFSEFAKAMHGRIEPVYAGDVSHAATLADDHPSINVRQGFSV